MQSRFDTALSNPPALDVNRNRVPAPNSAVGNLRCSTENRVAGSSLVGVILKHEPRRLDNVSNGERK